MRFFPTGFLLLISLTCAGGCGLDTFLDTPSLRDAGMLDRGSTDTSRPDRGTDPTDVGGPDVSRPDTGTPDVPGPADVGGSPDAGMPDVPVMADAGPPDVFDPGVGRVQCGAELCEPGDGCCRANFSQSCVSASAPCACSAPTACVRVFATCDESADCAAGQICCGEVRGMAFTNSCQPSCDSPRREACREGSTCSTGLSCTEVPLFGVWVCPAF